MTNASEPELATVQAITPLRPRPERVTAVIGRRGPRGVSGGGGTVRALTAALAPHLSTADPELHDLAATLLVAQQAYAVGTSDAPGVDRDRVRREYFEAARDYCAAMERRGVVPPPGLLEAEHWLNRAAEPLPTRG